MSKRNGMDGLSEAAPRLVRYTWDEMTSYEPSDTHGLKRQRTAERMTPNLELLRGPTMMDTIKDRHSSYFFIKDYTGFGDGDEWHAVLDYIEMVFSVTREKAREIWKRVKVETEIRTLTKYVNKSELVTYVELVLCGEDDKDNSMTAVMTKTGLYKFLNRLSPDNKERKRMRDCAVKIMAQIIADEASNMENAKAKTASFVQESAAKNTVINDTESEPDVQQFDSDQGGAFIHTST
jgi:hypothetical protein